MTEVEIKARVLDPNAAERAIRAVATFRGESVKRDVYWLSQSLIGVHPVRVRIREETFPGVEPITTVTYKRKETRGTAEVNDEREFSISDRAAFETLLKDLSFAPYQTKTKKTKTFDYRKSPAESVSVELSEVEGLGYFAELEVLLDSPTEEEVGLAQNLLQDTLKACGIGEEAIETRYYTELLALRTK